MFIAANYNFLILKLKFKVSLYSQEHHTIIGFSMAKASHAVKGLCYTLRTNSLAANLACLFHITSLIVFYLIYLIARNEVCNIKPRYETCCAYAESRHIISV